MAPNKKKKKPQGNPARGFATTSVASKPKQPEKEKDKDEPSLPEKQDAPALAPEVAPATVTPPPQEVHQTPEELEAQLERDELQLLVEKHAPRVRRESRRHAAKLQTDRRVLRTQAESITTHDWLSHPITDSIIALAQTESRDSNRKQSQQSLLKVLSEEDAMAKLWMLDLVLRDMAFAPEHIEPVLRWLCANAVAVDATASVWGLQEALEWLALDHAQGFSLPYDEPPRIRQAATTPGISRSMTPVPEPPTLTTTTEKEQPQVPDPAPAVPDIEVSDLDSDLEPDQLVPTWLQKKGKLFDLDPDSAEPKTSKSGKGGKGRKPANVPQSPAVRKLLAQVQRLESDALFDEIEAGTQWPVKRAEIARNKASERQQKPAEATKPANVGPAPSTLRKTPAWKKSIQDDNSDDGSDEEDALLGGMFSAVPDEVPNGSDPVTSAVTLRDFGKQTGVTPRRVLEEALRAR